MLLFLNKYVREIVEVFGMVLVMVILLVMFFNNIVDLSLGFSLVNGDAFSVASISDCDLYVVVFVNVFSMFFL